MFVSGGVNQKQLLNAVQIVPQRSNLTVQQLHQIISKQPFLTSSQQPTIIATVTQSQAMPQMGTKVIVTTATIQSTQLHQTMQSGAAATATGNVTVPSSHIVSLPQGQSSLTASIVKPGSSGNEAVTTVQIHPISSLTQSKLTGLAQNVLVTPLQQVTMAGSGATQHVVTAPQITAHPTQTLQVTVPASSITQTLTGPHLALQSHRGVSGSPAPLTVTMTPTQQTTTQQVQGTTVTYTATPISQASSASGQQQSLGEQVTILQRQPTVQVQHTPSQPASQTIHIQSSGQAGVAGQAASSHTTPQGKTTYSMRTRNQSKPQ